MKVLHFDQINPVTGKLFTMDDPNLFFGADGIGYYLEKGDPGYVPYPEEEQQKPAKKKPFHRAAKQPDNNTPQNQTTRTMNTFQYNIVSNPKGGFSSRIVLGDQIVEADLTAQIATAAGVTPAQADTVIKTLLSKLLDAASGCSWSPGLYGGITVRPTTGGSETAPDMFHNADDINANVQIAFTAERIRTWRSALDLESQGQVGFVIPCIDTILCEENGATDHYMPGTLIRLRGDNLKFKKTDLTQGVFFTPASGPEVRATVYGILDPSEATVLVPATLSGPLTVRIATFINGSVRSCTYTHTIS
jgi:hypothetical protein